MQIRIPDILEYKGKRVLTTPQLADCYGVTSQMITNNFNNNKGKYTEGIHYLFLEDKEKLDFLNLTKIRLGSLKNAKRLYLWSERGVLLHAKSLNTERAWQVYERLIDSYFSYRQQAFISSNLENGKVLASEVYSYLGLSRGNYLKWVERNITGNRFAVDGLDYRYIGNNDFILSGSLIQCMCMMSQTDDGELCRQEYIRKLREYDTLLSVLGIRRKEQLSLQEMDQRDSNPLISLEYLPQSRAAPAAGIGEKRLLSMKEFCTYAGIGKTKARSYAEENGLIVRIGSRILVDRIKLDRLCDNA